MYKINKILQPTISQKPANAQANLTVLVSECVAPLWMRSSRNNELKHGRTKIPLII